MLLCDYYNIQLKKPIPKHITFSCQSATSILDATLLLYAILVDLNRFLLPLLYVFTTVSSYFSYACSIGYFAFCTIAILTAFSSVVRTFVTFFSIKTQYSMQTHDNNVSVDNTKSSSKFHEA